MRLHIKNGRIVDPASGKEGSGDVFIADGKISPEGGKADRVIDAKGLVDMLRRRAKALSRARVYPVGALTVKLKGETLTEMGQLTDAGCVAFSQANVPMADTQVLWRALQYAATFGFPVWLRAEDVWLAKGGVAHDGEVATRLGLPGIPSFADWLR